MANTFLEQKKSLPVLGLGLGLRNELAKDILESNGLVDWLEFVPENYMKLGGNSQALLSAAAEKFPLISHGVNLSIGSTDELNLDYLKALKTTLDDVNCSWWSDHLCFSSVSGTYMHDLLPLPFSIEAIKHVSKRIKQAQEFVERPFLIENISFYMHMPGCEMNEAEFTRAVIEEADCGLLLDVNNVYVNSVNHNFNAKDFIDSLPLERVVQIHVAGHTRQNKTIIDTHGEAVIEPVYDLLKYVLSKTSVNAVMLERDQNFPAFEKIVEELELIKAIIKKQQPPKISNINNVVREHQYASLSA